MYPSGINLPGCENTDRDAVQRHIAKPPCVPVLESFGSSEPLIVNSRVISDRSLVGFKQAPYRDFSESVSCVPVAFCRNLRTRRQGRRELEFDLCPEGEVSSDMIREMIGIQRNGLEIDISWIE
jgi:hypothetical protein